MKVGLYFGSFNPIHVGHLIIAGFIANNTDVQQVWFIVSPQNPLKDSSGLLNEYNRLHLVKLATEGDSKIKVSDVEFKLPRPSFTIDTLTYLQEKYPLNEFSVIIGSDSFQNINKWKNYQALIKNYNFIIYERLGFKINNEIGANISIVKAPLLDVSATMIRNNIKEGKSIRYFVPESVREEIEKGAYYK